MQQAKQSRNEEFSYSQDFSYRTLYRVALSLYVNSAPMGMRRRTMAALQKATGFQAAVLLMPAEARGKLELASHIGLTPPKTATLRRKLAAAENSRGILSNLRRR